jgi:hypothetical protein
VAELVATAYQPAGSPNGVKENTIAGIQKALDPSGSIRRDQDRRAGDEQMAFARYLNQKSLDSATIPPKSNMAFALCWNVYWNDSVQILYDGKPLLVLRRR